VVGVDIMPAFVLLERKKLLIWECTICHLILDQGWDNFEIREEETKVVHLEAIHSSGANHVDKEEDATLTGVVEDVEML
jgi:hypothetical protein